MSTCLAHTESNQHSKVIKVNHKSELSQNDICELFPGYVTDVLDDAKVYSNHAYRKSIDADDIKLAVQMKMDHSFTTPPPKDVSFRPIELSTRAIF